MHDSATDGSAAARRGHRAGRHRARPGRRTWCGPASPLSVCDIRAEATEPFRDGAHVAASPGELAGHSDVVMVAVVNDEQVRGVLAGADGVFAGASPAPRSSS